MAASASRKPAGLSGRERPLFAPSARLNIAQADHRSHPAGETMIHHDKRRGTITRLLPDPSAV
jgi:hypothetical protein